MFLKTIDKNQKKIYYIYRRKKEMNDKQALEKVIKEQGSNILSEKGNVYTNYEGSIYRSNLNEPRKEILYIGEVYKGKIFTIGGNLGEDFYKLDENIKTIGSISEEVFKNIYITIIKTINTEVNLFIKEETYSKYRDHVETNLSHIIYNRIKYGEYFIKESNTYAIAVHKAIGKYLSNTEIVRLYIDKNYKEFVKDRSGSFSYEIIEQNRAIQKVIREKNIERHIDKFTRVYEYHEALMKLDMNSPISIQYKVSGAIDIIDSLIKESVVNRLKGEGSNDDIEYFKEWRNQIRRDEYCEIEFIVSDLHLEDSINILSKAISQIFFMFQNSNIYFKAVRWFENMDNVISIKYLGEDVVMKDMFN